jgi:hypothetical protein
MGMSYQSHMFQFPPIGNANVRDAQTCEVGG